MGISNGALFSAFLATRSAFSGSVGRGPQDLDQTAFLAIWKEIAAIGRSSEARRWSLAPPDRQSGKPGPTGMPAARTARRSGGKTNPNSASARANSASERPCCTSMPEFRSWVITLSTTEENETTPFRTGTGSDDDEEEDEAARADNRRRPAMWAGFRPAILRSTSTIVVLYCNWRMTREC